jgi:hypothetical protein
LETRADLCRIGCYWRKESGVKLRELFRGGDFVDDGLRGGARIGRGKNRSANHEEIGSGANRFGRCGFPGLVF